MALLVVQLPARPRDAAAMPASAGAGAAYAWALSSDGAQISRQGQGAPDQWPPADTVVAVLAPTDVAWHRITCPKAPAARLRAALGGVLEEQLLDDDDTTHLALAPGHAAGQPAWVAAVHKPWLASQLEALAAAGRPADRAVPALAPVAAQAGAPMAHFFTLHGLNGTDRPGAWLSLADAEQALCLPVAGGFAGDLLARWRQAGASVGSTPAAATAAERLLGGPVAIRSDAEQALAATQNGWQLLQFDLAPRRHGARLLGSVLQQLRSPAWRPVRWGLAVLAAVQLVGLNAYAWRLQQDVQQRRQAQEALLRSAHPQVRAVLDAPVQMQRESERLREAAGVPGDADFETLLAALSQAWPEGAAPAPQLRFENGRLSVPAAALAPPQAEQLRARLRAGGWSLDQADGRLTLQKARAAAPT